MKAMTIREAYNWGKQFLKENNIDNYEGDSFELLSNIKGMDKTYYFLHGNDVFSDSLLERYENDIKRRAEHIPLQHITGKAYFYGREYIVDNNVLVPRSDTEVLVEKVLLLAGKNNIEEPIILDICTGSGCILLSLADKLRMGRFVGIDISNKAIEVADNNKKYISKQAQLDISGISFFQNDLFEDFTKLLIVNYLENVFFDFIVSNPPYIPTKDIEELDDEVKLHDPRIALDGREDGLFFYREIIKKAPDYIKKGGYLCFEIGYNQGEDVSRLMTIQGFTDIEVIRDLNGLDRVVIGRFN